MSYNTNILKSYNANGAMTNDKNKGMTVTYNVLNLPESVELTKTHQAGSTFYTYSADGVKRSVTHKWMEELVRKPEINDKGMPPVIIIGTVIYKSKTTDYVGNKIYEKDDKIDKLEMILFGNGYIKDGIYHFYIRDHLGSNRVVLKLEKTIFQTEVPNISELEDVMDRNGEFHNQLYRYTVVQRTDYYPSGLSFPEMENPNEQPYKYNGKEFDTMHGLNFYDFGARFYDAAIMRTTTPDPLMEKFYSESPYSWCGNNPLIYIDPTGMGYRYNWETNQYEYINDEDEARDATWEEVLNSIRGVGDKSGENSNEGKESSRLDWSKISNEDRTWAILNAIRDANAKGVHYFALSDVFINPKAMVRTGAVVTIDDVKMRIGIEIGDIRNKNGNPTLKIGISPSQYSNIDNPTGADFGSVTIKGGYWQRIQYSQYIENPAGNNKKALMSIVVENTNLHRLNDFLIKTKKWKN